MGEKKELSSVQDLRKELEELLSDKNLSELGYSFREKLIGQGGYAEFLAQKIEIKRTQLRKYFNEIKRLKLEVKKIKENDILPDKIKIKLKRLVALLAYAASPKRRLISRDFYEIIVLLINKVSEGRREDFEIFEEFFEAIIAYHTYYKPWEE